MLKIIVQQSTFWTQNGPSISKKKNSKLYQAAY